jgi:hypothetical protein
MSGAGRLEIAFLVAGTLLVAWRAWREGVGEAASRPRPAGFDAAFIAVAALVAAWPVLHDPFAIDSPVLRAYFARQDLFGDWNHPFLPYLLNRPAAVLTLDPVALRVVPFLWFLCACLLLLALVGREAGRAAGLLAALWLVAELRRRHGLVDLGDWDLAGLLLLAWFAWVRRLDPPDPGPRLRTVAVGAALLAAGVLSSWLMLVPAAVLVAVAAPRVGWAGAAVLVAVLATLCLLAARVWSFGTGVTDGGPADLAGLLAGMARETPAWRNPLMLLPIAAGIGWAAAGIARPSWRFTLGSVATVPAAVAAAWAWSHVNGGYYVGLVTPLLILAAGAALAIAPPALAAPASLASARRLVAPAVLAALAAATTLVPPFEPESGGAGHLAAFERATREDGLPILTDSIDLPKLMLYHRAREGAGVSGLDGVLFRARGTDLERRIRLLDPATCEPEGGRESVGGAWHLATYSVPGVPEPACLRALRERCSPLYGPGPPGSGPLDLGVRWRFYRCGGIAPHRRGRPAARGPRDGTRDRARGGPADGQRPPRAAGIARRSVSAVAWGTVACGCGMVLAMAVGALATRLDGHGLGFLGATVAPFAFVPGAWLGWRHAHNTWVFRVGVALLVAGAVAANVWKSL